MAHNRSSLISLVRGPLFEPLREDLRVHGNALIILLRGSDIKLFASGAVDMHIDAVVKVNADRSTRLRYALSKSC